MKTLKKLINELSDSRKRLIFISYPTKQSLDGAYKICHYWWGRQYIPICPRIMFSYMNNDKDRAVIMIICKILVWLCGNFALYGESAGCKDEFKLAKKWDKEIFVLFDDNVNFRRMMEKNREVMLP